MTILNRMEVSRAIEGLVGMGRRTVVMDGKTNDLQFDIP